ncbi:MAG: transketolase [Myxococcota bacterium]|jgi:transketolase|nr:transketolase [Myxococcota bacterium]
MSTESNDLSPELRQKIENTIRFLSVDAIRKANSGHLGAPMALAGPVFELWNSQLRFDPTDSEWPLRDRFVLSGGHASMLLYSLLHLFGYDVSMDDLRDFRQLESKTPGHPEYGDTPGVEMTTGPLGQGMAHAVGVALGARMAGAQFGSGEDGTPGCQTIYGVCGDGDLMEGVSGEASSLAGHLGLGNLIFLYDDNKITIDGGTDISFSEDVKGRYESYGWHVIDGLEGQDHKAIRAALETAKRETTRPSLLIVRTLIGLGAPTIEGTSKAHGAGLSADDVPGAKEHMGWPTSPDFHVPDEVRAFFAARSSEKRAERVAVDAKTEAWRAAEPRRAAAFDGARERAVPTGLAEALCDGMDTEAATRQHSGKVLQKLSTLVPYMAGGSADLAGSAAPPIIKDVGIVGRDSFEGRNIHFGVREHAMGAIANGLALEGTFLPYSGTFMIFSDYVRPAVRLAALMKLRSIFVFTHDSFYVGEDGPTHQPVEQVDSLRLIPGLTVFRPADGRETAMAYAWTLQSATGPVVMSLTRQGVPALDRAEGFDNAQILRGGYTLREVDGTPDVVIVASGSEVSLACDTAEVLESEGKKVRVVSVPSLELLKQQPDDYIDGLLPEGVPAVAVEAGTAQSLATLVGRRGLVCGMDRFGASAPAGDLARHFGFTADALAPRIRDFLA